MLPNAVLTWTWAELIEGTHSNISVGANDGKGGASSVICSHSLTVDKTAPVSNAPTVTVTGSTTMTISPNAMDPVSNGVSSGLGGTPYHYNLNGIDVGSYQSGNFMAAGLFPNQFYNWRYRTRDVAGNEGTLSPITARYTLAMDPILVASSNTTTNSVTIQITDHPSNSNTPQWRLELRQGATTISTSDFSTSPNRTLSGLSPAQTYEVWVTTRNGDNVENAPVQHGTVTTNAIPVITVESTSMIRSANPGYTSIVISGTVQDGNNDNVTVTGTIDNKVKQTTTTGTLSPRPWSLIWDVADDNIAQGLYTNISINANDGRGGNGTAVFTGTITIDKTAPTAGIPSVFANSSSQITVTPNANDTGGAGLADSPYLFRVNGITEAGYINGSLSKSGLLANTQYVFDYYAKDAVDNVSLISNSVSRYTLAALPTGIKIIANTDSRTTLELVEGNNGADPLYSVWLQSGIHTVGNSTNFVGQTIWTFDKNVAHGPVYEVWANALNGDGIETTPQIIGYIINLDQVPPSLAISTPNGARATRSNTVDLRLEIDDNLSSDFSFSVNGGLFSPVPESKIIQVPLSLGNNDFSIVVKDGTGNPTAGLISIWRVP